MFFYKKVVLVLFCENTKAEYYGVKRGSFRPYRSQCMKNPAEPRAFYLCRHICQNTGGWGGIRTPGGVATSAVFKTVAFDRSATHPKLFLPLVFQTCGFVRLSQLSLLLTTPLRSASRDMFASLTRTQDRRIRPLCHPSETFFFRRSFKPAVLFACRNSRCCSLLLCARLHAICLPRLLVRKTALLPALPPIRNFFLPSVFQTCGCAMCIIAYFFLNANAKINRPAKNNITDNNCPIVRPHEVRNPI